jgi:hypothetical protein
MAEYIPKIRIAVMVAQAGEPQVHGHLSLAPHSSQRLGPETLFERLNAPDRLIPFHRAGDGATVMLARDAIEWVAATPDVEDARLFPPPVFTTAEERVRVWFKSGASLEGMLRIELPEHLNRASDFLNGAEDFFPLMTGGAMRLINKQQILEVEVFETSPLPPQVARSHA